MLDYNQKCAMNEDFNYFNLTFWERERGTHPSGLVLCQAHRWKD